MKKTALICLFSAITTFSLYSQTEQTYTEMFDSIFSNVSRTQATTGILYERVVPFANLLNFNSQINSSIDTSNSFHFIQAYSEIYRAAFVANAQPRFTVETFEDLIQTNLSQNIVDIGLLYYNFNIMDSVVGKAKLSLDSTTGLVKENTTITNSLYLQKTAFVVSPLSDKAYGTVKFRFNNNFVFDNTGTSLITLRVDFGDGQGFRTITPNSVISVSYPNNGLKILRFAAAFANGQRFTAYATIDYQQILLTPKGNTSAWSYTKEDTIYAKIPFTNFYAGQAPSGTATGYVKTYYANADKILRKPILIVDGFDPGNARKFETHTSENGISLWGLLSYKDNANIEHHFGDSLLKLGYDLVILDLPDGGGYIEHNAMVCIEVINELNRRLSAAGTTEKLVIVGPSMGGQITRYALAYMEQNHNINTNYGNHNCRLWVSFDSPHQGANISYGAQMFLYFFGKYYENKTAKNKYNNTINCVAAQQMLKKHHNGSANTVYNTYYNSLNTLGYPTNLRKIAISNGSLNAISNGIGCDLVVDMNTYLCINLAKVRLWPDEGTCEIFAGNSLNDLLGQLVGALSSFFKEKHIVSADVGQCGIDGAPGCKFNTFGEIKAAVQGEKGVHNIDVKNESHCFMPTLSVLDIYGITNYCTDISTSNLATENKTPFDAYWGPINKNMDHVSFDQNLVHWLLNEIEMRQDGVSIIGTNIICTTESFNLNISNPNITWHVTSGFALATPHNVTPTRVSPTTSLNGQTGTLTALINGVPVATKFIRACGLPCDAWYSITDDCVNCGACMSECPVNAIAEGDSKYQIDHLACVNCGACAGTCPVIAIAEPCNGASFDIPVIVGEGKICTSKSYSLSIPNMQACWSVTSGFSLSSNHSNATSVTVSASSDGQKGFLTAIVNGIEIIKPIEACYIYIRPTPNSPFCIDRDICFNCGYCTRVCPVDAIEEESVNGHYGIYKINEYCVDCGACWSECPAGAINTCYDMPLFSAKKSNDTTSSVSNAVFKQDDNDKLVQKNNLDNKPVNKVCPKKGKTCTKKSGGCCSGNDTTSKQKTINIQSNVYFKVSPNPVTGTLIIQKIINTNNLISDKTISYELYNQSSLQLAGKGSFEGNNHQINVSSFANGVYLLRLAIGEHTEVHRIVVEK